MHHALAYVKFWERVVCLDTFCDRSCTGISCIPSTKGATFSLQFTKNRSAAGLRPDPLGELERSPRPSSRNRGGATSQGRGRERKKGELKWCDRIKWGGEGKGREGKEDPMNVSWVRAWREWERDRRCRSTWRFVSIYQHKTLSPRCTTRSHNILREH